MADTFSVSMEHDPVRISTGEDYSLGLAQEVLSPREYLLLLYPDKRIAPIELTGDFASPVKAFVNHGRWIWRCDCSIGLANKLLNVVRRSHAGGMVFFGIPIAWCMRCGNGTNRHTWRRIELPSDAMREQIESILVLRGNVEDRNWEPTETIDDLLMQNREHQEPVPSEVS